MVDNFVTCDTSICAVGGRDGYWFAYASADINQSFSVSQPSSGFMYKGCAAWSTGGQIPNTTAPSTYAGVGLTLADGSPYDLSGYTGVIVSLESGQGVHFVVEDALGNYYATDLAPSAGTAPQSYQIPFSSLTPLSPPAPNPPLRLAMAVSLEFDSDTPTAYGFAIFSVNLY